MTRGTGNLEEEVVSVSFAFSLTPQWTQVYVSGNQEASRRNLLVHWASRVFFEVLLNWGWGERKEGDLSQPSPEPRGHSAVLRFKGNAEQTARTLAVALTKRQEMPASSRNGQDSHSQGMLRQQRGNGQVLRGDSAAQETQRRCLLNL